MPIADQSFQAAIILIYDYDAEASHRNNAQPKKSQLDD